MKNTIFLLLAFASAGAATHTTPKAKIQLIYQAQPNGDYRLFLFGGDKALVCEEKDIKIVSQGDAVNPLIIACDHSSK